MTEIKSTLELVMEKTKDLNFNPEEREEQKRKEVQLKVEALLQKYQENELKREQLEKALTNLEKYYGRMVKPMLGYKLIEQIDLDGNLSLILDLLNHFFSLETDQIGVLIHNFNRAIQSFSEERVRDLKELLDKKYHISGSAVFPNLEKDETWIATVKEIREKFNQQLGEEKRKLKERVRIS